MVYSVFSAARPLLLCHEGLHEATEPGVQAEDETLQLSDLQLFLVELRAQVA